MPPLMNWHNIDDDSRRRVIEDAIQLMSTITEAFGAEEGLVIWDKVSAAFGESAKADMFFAMVTQGTDGINRTVRVDSYPADKKVTFIKLIREFTGLGLKEAKDLSEGNFPITFRVKGNEIRKCRDELRSHGIRLT